MERAGNLTLDLNHRARARLLANRDLGPVVLGDDTLHQEACYTSITRGRELNHVYAIAAIDPDSPTADLQRALAISTAEQTAHDRGGLGLWATSRSTSRPRRLDLR